MIFIIEYIEECFCGEIHCEKEGVCSPTVGFIMDFKTNLSNYYDRERFTIFDTKNEAIEYLYEFIMN